MIQQLSPVLLTNRSTTAVAEQANLYPPTRSTGKAFHCDTTWLYRCSLSNEEVESRRRTHMSGMNNARCPTSNLIHEGVRLVNKTQGRRNSKAAGWGQAGSLPLFVAVLQLSEVDLEEWS